MTRAFSRGGVGARPPCNETEAGAGTVGSVAVSVACTGAGAGVEDVGTGAYGEISRGDAGVVCGDGVL